MIYAEPMSTENIKNQAEPLYSKTRVTNAGKRISKGIATAEDWEVMENWRTSHSYIINTFRISLSRNISETKKKKTVLAQRLKRLSTIVDKLTTGRAKDLASMHDLAGCRLIFDTIKDLNSYRKKIHKSRFKHKRVNGDRYNYINEPKPTGYRGIHDVFCYQVSSVKGQAYNGLLMEIQYRTNVQHAWATAVEISDLINKTRVKFDKGAEPKRERFFVLASEFLARRYEESKGALPELTDEAVIKELNKLEKDIHIVRSLKAVHKERTKVPTSKNIVLHFKEEKLEIKGFNSSPKAIEYRNRVESEHPQDDVVYVRGENSNQISNAFRNYFRNSEEFVRLIEVALDS